MKKKIIMALLVMATVVGMGFAAEDMCINADRMISLSSYKDTQKITYYNKSLSKTITVEYTLRGDRTTSVKKGSVQIKPASSRTVSTDFAIQSESHTAEYCN